uniref:CCA tRNA nucleotidyltransferase 1, mitochondrial-like n=1 Tax=Phallusia mammillata TaxID=59560 RepID=A0A6F9DUY7_9ASCI|nr:CCA tRNA nucleotidyltransferase 1, mitochondrial-like [Phallusia mammillata]
MWPLQRFCGVVHRSFNSLRLLEIFRYRQLSNITVSKARFSSKAASQMLSADICKQPEPTANVKINTPQFQSLFTEGLKTVQKLFKDNNYELRLCGGAVRDLLMNKEPKDIDLATVATPDQMVAMFEKQNIRLISANGISHGTVTCRIAEQNMEITTLRIDKVTDGRHAEVVFTDDWFLDASRRDLTFNAMFLTLDGQLIDFYNGKDDLENLRVKFVGEAEQRIKEDFLRILRYFRFFGKIADDNTKHDIETLNCITQNAHGLAGISGERLWMELKLILCGRFVFESFKCMHQCGLFPYLGLPSEFNSDLLETVCAKARHLNMHHVTPLAALFNTLNEVDICCEKLKLSNAEYHILWFIVAYKHTLPKGNDRFNAYMEMLVSGYRFRQELLSNLHELLKFAGDIEALDYFTNFKVPSFPLGGEEVKSRGQIKGKQIAPAMSTLFAIWRHSGYTLSKQQLLEHFGPDTNWTDLQAMYPQIETKFAPKKRRKL